MEIVLKNVGIIYYVDVLTVRYIIVSSAKSRTLLLTELGRSFIYARKRHEPNTDPEEPQILQVKCMTCIHLFLLFGCDIVKMS